METNVTTARKARAEKIRKVRLARGRYERLRDRMLGVDDWEMAISAAGIRNEAAVNSLVYDFAKTAGKVMYAVHREVGNVIPALLTDMGAGDVNVALRVGPGDFRIVSGREMEELAVFEDMAQAVAYSKTIRNNI